MEPRPQKPRQPQGGRPAQPGDGGTPPQPPQQGYTPLPGQEPQAYPQYDPGAFVASPRTDYDYSPLDLAPPGQRRRRQVIAGVIGALAVVLLGALIVFGWMLLRGEDGGDSGTNIAAVATESPAANDVAGANTDATPTPETAPTEAAQPTQPVSPTPTPQPAGPAVDTSEAGLTQLLPDPALAPAGFDSGTDSSNDLAAVVAAIGGNRQAEQNLTDWGWTANVSRAFNNTAPTDGSTDALLASLHGFKDAPSAAAALTFYADYLASTGASDVDAPALGDSARMLTSTDETGNVSVSLYVQQGPVLYRFWGVASAGGDPTQAVIDFATQTLGS